MSWTDEIVARMKVLNRQGLSRSQIAKDLNREFNQTFTRNAVISKIDRIDVQPTMVKASPPTRRAALPVKVTAPKSRPPARMPVAAVQAAPLPKGGPSDAIATNPMPLLHPDFDVRRACRWPLVTPAADGELLYCCNRRPFGETYCEEHLRWKDPKHRTSDQIRAELEHKARMTATATRGRTYTSRFDRKMAS